MMLKNLLLIAALAAGLSACSSTKPDAPKEPPKEEALPKAEELKTDNLICPQVAILRTAEESHDYGLEKPDEAQLVASARLNGVEGDCGYQKNGIDIKFTLHTAAKRGPRLGGKYISFPFFVAVVDPSEKILTRETMTAEFRFSGSDVVVLKDRPLHVMIPLAKEAQQAGPDYRVLIGFNKTGINGK